MPRQPRKMEVGGIYHIVNRGVEKRKIFRKSQDYSRFLFALEFFNSRFPMNLWELIARAGSVPALERIKQQRKNKPEPIVELLAFTLMPNHFHLIVREIISGGTVSFMRKLGGYSGYFNRQYDRVGPLFQSRYKSVPITTDEQLQIAFAYTHTNPIELFEPGWKEHRVANSQLALQQLEAYRWSSYRDYIGTATFSYALQKKFFLDFFGDERACADVVKRWVEYKAQSADINFILS